MSLISRYKLDGDATDSVSSNNGTNYGVTFGSGVFGQCANFVTNDYIDCGSTTDLNPTSVSISVWMKFNSFQIGAGVALGASAGTRGIFMGSCLSSNVRFAVYSSGFKYVNIPQSEITLGEWNHYCLTFDDATKIISLYLNGSLYGTVAGTTSIIYQNDTWFGKFSSFYFDGSLDDIRIYDHALTEQEIKQLYFQGFPIKALLCSYGFEDSLDLGYDSIEKLPATNYGATQGTGVNGGNAAVFDGINDYIVNEEIAPTESGSFSFNVFATAWGTSSSNRRTVLSNNSGVVEVASLGGGQIRVGLFETGGAYKSYTITGLSLNTWYNITFTFDTSIFNVYLDNVLKSTQAFAGLDTTYGNGLWLGKAYGTFMIRYWDGKIDKLNVFNYALSEQEITDLYNYKRVSKANKALVAYLPFESTLPSLGTDASGNGNHGTVYGVTQGVGKIGGAGVFDGTNDYIEIPHNSGLNITNKLTICGWVKSSTLQANKYIISKPKSIGTANGWDLNTGSTVNKLRFITVGTSPNTFEISANIYDGLWRHIAVTYDGSIKKFYINGVVVATQLATGNIEINANNLFIGTFSNSLAFFDGSLSKVKILNTALSEQNIRREMIGLPSVI